MIFRRALINRCVAAGFVLLPASLMCQAKAYAEDQHMTVLSQVFSGPLRCEIRRSGEGHAVRLSGVVASTDAVDGNFRFSVMKSGPSGSSNINQSNKFHLDAGKEIYVGQMTVSLEPGAHASVELLVSSNGIDCHAKASLDR